MSHEHAHAGDGYNVTGTSPPLIVCDWCGQFVVPDHNVRACRAYYEKIVTETREEVLATRANRAAFTAWASTAARCVTCSRPFTPSRSTTKVRGGLQCNNCDIAAMDTEVDAVAITATPVPPITPELVAETNRDVRRLATKHGWKTFSRDGRALIRLVGKRQRETGLVPCAGMLSRYTWFLYVPRSVTKSGRRTPALPRGAMKDLGLKSVGSDDAIILRGTEVQVARALAEPVGFLHPVVGRRSLLGGPKHPRNTGVLEADSASGAELVSGAREAPEGLLDDQDGGAQ